MKSLRLVALPPLVACPPLALLLAGCIAVPTAPPQMCHVDSDCDTGAGEVCQQGVCWGDPPATALAAVLVAPKDRTELATTELPSFAVPPDGWFGSLPYDAPVTISGQLSGSCGAATCDMATLDAEVTITRPSRIPNGPPFREVATAKNGAFSLVVPPTRDGDPPYTVTIRPDDRAGATAATPAPAELVPPAHQVLSASGNVSMDVALATGDAITGQILDGNGKPLPGYRVVALGTWGDGSATTEVSTVDYSTDGTYAITLAAGVKPPVEVVALPYDTDTLAPELHLSGVSPGVHTLAQPRDVGSPLAVTVTVVGTSNAGELAPVAGAQVTIAATLATASPIGPTAHASTVFTATGATDGNGRAALDILDGSALMGSYTVTVVPPANSNLGVSYAQPLVLDGTGVMTVHLASRLALSGVLLDSRGAPLSNVSVTARPSLAFMWSLEPADQPFLAQIPAATAVTSTSGDFVMWVDPEFAQTWGTYDLEFDPPDGSDQPSFTFGPVDVPRVPGQTSDALGELAAPEGAHLHGQLVDGLGTPVQTGELRVYVQAQSDGSLCGLRGAPAGCAIPAQLVGHGTSDDTGTVRVTVPR